MKQAPLEKTIVNAILLELKRRGIWAMKLHGSPFARAGVPDVIGCLPSGQLFGLECKRSETEKPTALQVREMERMEAAGALVAVVRSKEEALRALGLE